MPQPLPETAHYQALASIESWFARRQWLPFPFQHDCWHAFLEGKSGLLNAPTGSGKTYALWMPCLAEWLSSHAPHKAPDHIQVLWITPLRALTKDIHRAMQAVCDDLEIPWTVSFRTGDTSAAERQKQKRKPPACLITTPESLHLMLAQKGYPQQFAGLKAIIIDEWHELLGSKRGVQVELGLARLRTLNPQLKVWGISATIGNMEEAAQVLGVKPGEIIRAHIRKKVAVVSILPDEVEKFPWTGHLGTNLIHKILPIIAESRTTLLFVNTRAQAEIWYHQLMDRAPELAGLVAMHHGSLDIEIRNWVEENLHTGRLKLVVCTSSLDLGVDFRPVETVIQVGSPKGVGRFLQRAGRSGHRPDALSTIYFLPTHSLELLEGAALAQAVEEVTQQGNLAHLEGREPLHKPMDVLVQYLVTLAVSEGFTPNALYPEICSTYAYRNLTPDEWAWALQFITSGGESLEAYQEFSRVEIVEGVYRVLSKKAALRHRMGMGTIVSEPVVKIKMMNGAFIGTVEEYFVAWLKKGDVFWFAGRNLEFVKLDKMTALVRKSNKKKGKVPQWMGGRLMLTSELSELIREKLQTHETPDTVEIQTIQPILSLQKEWSCIPGREELLIETIVSDEGYHLFMYPFEGRMVHEVMAAVISYRISQLTPITFSFAMNDYGFELLADSPIPLEHALEMDLFRTEDLLFDVEQSLNKTEMAKRRFREIATIAGLVFQGYPGKNKSNKHLQASTQLLYEVFETYDPDNLLIRQSFQEVMDMQLEHGRLHHAFEKIKNQRLVIKRPPRFTPFSFPILVDRLREKISSESIEDRVKKMQLQLEAYAAG